MELLSLLGDDLRTDVLLKSVDNILYILELTVGFETSLKGNALCRKPKYYNITMSSQRRYKDIRLVNLSLN